MTKLTEGLYEVLTGEWNRSLVRVESLGKFYRGPVLFETVRLKVSEDIEMTLQLPALEGPALDRALKYVYDAVVSVANVGELA